MAEAPELVLALTTVPDVDVGERIVGKLVEERLIACGNLLPGLTSIYHWQGTVAREGEVLVLMKTVRPRVDEVFQRVAELHPYELPELVAVSVDQASNAYCRWVRQETTEVSS